MEARRKALARRTEIAYEAVVSDEKADIFKVRNLYGNGTDVYAAGISVKVTRITRGGLSICHRLPEPRGDGMGGQESADGIVGHST